MPDPHSRFTWLAVVAAVALALVLAITLPNLGKKAAEPEGTRIGGAEYQQCLENNAKYGKGTAQATCGNGTSQGGEVSSTAAIGIGIGAGIALFVVLMLLRRFAPVVAARQREARAARATKPPRPGPRIGAASRASAEAAPGDTGRPPERPEVEVNTAGVAIALFGAALMVVAVFLPWVESTTFFRIQDNSLIQQGDGWIFIGLAVGIALAVWASTQRHKTTWVVVVLAIIALGLIIYDGTGSRLDLQSVAASPLVPSHAEHGNPGIGIWAEGVGAVLAGLGGLLLAGVGFGAARDVPSRRLKKCPDCSETVLADAHVCKHCGYRFEPTT